MATFLETAYSMVHQDNTSDQPTLQEFRTQLEKGTDETKVETMKRILTVMLNGDAMPQLLMHIIRFVMPSKSKALKKLLYLYYEICPKLDANGKLKQEMILVCNGIRMDLQHANEYIRGNTLRFLCKLREPELIEPLLAPARACLEHRHSYVRKNAVFAIASIYQHSEALMPDAPELIQIFLESESDNTCKRNAFAALLGISHEKALEYLSGVFEGIPNASELLQLVELEFIRKDAVQNQSNKARYLRLIFDLLEAKESTVVYEAASSLTALTNNPVAVKAAAAKFIELAIKESDNNVKLIVLEKVNQLRQANHGILDDLTMEILRVLTSPDLTVRKKALELAMDMVSSKNVEEVVMLLKKELSKTMDEQYEKNNEYRSLLIHSIHQCAMKFSEIAQSVVGLLMDFISDFDNASAVDVISFVKEVVERFPKMRSSIVERLVATLSEVRAGKVYRGGLWIIGEYSLEENDIRGAWKRIRESLGEIPIVASEARLLEEQPNGETPQIEQTNGNTKPSAPTGSRKVLADGTYATESALTSTASANARLDAVKAAQKPPLRQLILDGDYFLATVLSSTLTKLVMRHSEISNDTARTNALRAEAMLIMISIIRAGQSQFVKAPIDEDSVDRIMSCVRSLAEFAQKKDLEVAFLDDTRKAFRDMVQVEEKKRAEKENLLKAKSAIQVDDVVTIRQLSKKGAGDGTDEIDTDLEKATGGDSATEELTSKLSRVVQLTGFSDPVYAEAYVRVHQFDIILDVLLVNQTRDTLQNLSVEFATLGDLKVVERPITQNLPGLDFLNVQATIKVSSTDTGVIFGNVVYDGPASTESNVVILNDVHVDIMDYIQPAQCTETQFRTMWTEFEWENKVNINTKMQEGTGLRVFLERLMRVTNMSCLTPEASLSGDCQFLSANLYARSVFGEDALANLSVEKEGENGPVTGFMRIRSRSQGLALSLGSLKGLGKIGDMYKTIDKKYPNGSPRTQSMSDSEAMKFALLFRSAAQDDRDYVRRELAARGDVLLARWQKKDVMEREAVLLRAMPNMYPHKNPEQELYLQIDRTFGPGKFASMEGKTEAEVTYFKNKAEGRQYALLLPYLNVETLKGDPSKLLCLLHQRSSNKIEAWVALDAAQMKVGVENSDLSNHYNENCVIMYGECYGLLIPYHTSACHSWSAIGFPRAILILQAQQVLFKFLRSFVDVMLGTDAIVSGDKEWRARAGPGFVVEDGMESRFSFSNQAFSAPPMFDPITTLKRVKAQLPTAEDHLYFLQTEPAYLRNLVRQFRSGEQYTKMPEAKVWGMIVADLMLYPIQNVKRLQDLVSECEHVVTVHAAHKAAIRLGQPLTLPYARAVGLLEFFSIEMYQHERIHLNAMIRDSPGFRGNYKSTAFPGVKVGITLRYVSHERDHIGVNRAFYQKEPLLFAFLNLTEDPATLKALYVPWLMNFIDEHLAQANSKERSRVDQRLHDHIARMSVYADIFATLRLQRPLAATASFTPTAQELLRPAWRKWKSTAHDMINGESVELSALLKAFYAAPLPNGTVTHAYLSKDTEARARMSGFWTRACSIRRRQITDIGFSSADFQADIDLLAAYQSPEHIADVAAEHAELEHLIAERVRALELKRALPMRQKDAWADSKEGRFEPAVDRSKHKTRPEITASSAPLQAPVTTNAQESAGQLTLLVKAQSLDVFVHLYPISVSALLGAVKWRQFVSAMVDTGCSATHSGGSAFTFEGARSVHRENTIVFHRPHPESEMNSAWLQYAGKRLRNRFGWSMDSFVERQKGQA